MGATDETNAVQDWEPPPGVIVSIVLGTVHMWHLRGTRNKVVDLIVRNFSASELLEARKELCKAVSADDPVTRRDSGQRSAAEAYAIDLLDQLGDLVVKENFQ